MGFIRVARCATLLCNNDSTLICDDIVIIVICGSARSEFAIFALSHFVYFEDAYE